MPRYFSRKAVFAVGAAFVCHIAFASAPTEQTQAQNANVQKEVPAKRNRPLYLSLPDSVLNVFKKPAQRIRAWFTRDQAAHTAVVDNNKKTEMNSSLSAPTLLPERDKRPLTSMYISLTPPAIPTDTPGPYQHDAAAANDSSCRTVNRTRGGSAESSERDIKGSLTSSLSVGLCMRF
jgi:hypothetical protein